MDEPGGCAPGATAAMAVSESGHIVDHCRAGAEFHANSSIAPEAMRLVCMYITMIERMRVLCSLLAIVKRIHAASRRPLSGDETSATAELYEKFSQFQLNANASLSALYMKNRP